MKKILVLSFAVLVLAIMLAACTPAPTPTSTPTATQFPPLPTVTAVPATPASTPEIPEVIYPEVHVVQDGDVLQLSGLEFPSEVTQEGPDGGTAIMVPAPKWQEDMQEPFPGAAMITAGKVRFSVVWAESKGEIYEELWIYTAGRNYILPKVSGGAVYQDLSAEIDGFKYRIGIWSYGEDIEHEPPSHIAVEISERPYQ